MKRFLTKTALFILIPTVSLGIIEALLPATFFTYRHWEALSIVTRVPIISKAFYPNIKSAMNAAGDLCHHTNKSILKNEFWITDKLGYRNDEFVDEADVLFIGDSFIAGSNLNQDEIISNRVKINNKSDNHYNLLVYNMAPGTFSTFDRYLKTGILKPPQLIIFSQCERAVPGAMVSYDVKKQSRLKNAIKYIFGIYNINVFIDKALRQYSVKWLRSRVHNSKRIGVPAKGNSNMYFLNGISQKQETMEDLHTTAKVIISYKKYCDSLGIDFLFLPMPNKETVYYELVPFDKQSNYLYQLDSLLCIAKVSTINTLKIYMDYRKTSNKLLYHLDDTHWNFTATELMSKEIVNKIRTNAQHGLGKRAGGEQK